TIRVLAGVYREQVSVAQSGASGAPLILEAATPAVTVDGADDFGSSGQWTAYSGNVWLASGVTWAPKQVFAAGARLPPPTAARAVRPLPLRARFRALRQRGWWQSRRPRRTGRAARERLRGLHARVGHDPRLHDRARRGQGHLSLDHHQQLPGHRLPGDVQLL